MFEYTEIYKKLKGLFCSEESVIEIPGSEISIHNISFCSESNVFYGSKEDQDIEENKSFTYPIFVPKSNSDRVIFLFHGLNERSWEKYLPWAYYLASEIKCPVVMFPISFHINRTPESWKNSRTTYSMFKKRQKENGDIEDSSFANITLSDRLRSFPLRFFASGNQTIKDVIQLALSIKEGKHPVLPKTDKIDIFSYSIGAFMSEIILMANPQKLFSNSKLFVFFGGPVFSMMYGVSKRIMDKDAYQRQYQYYVIYFEHICKKYSKKEVDPDVEKTFRSMLCLQRFSRMRNKAFENLRKRMEVITLKKDQVIPPIGVLNTLTKTGINYNVSILDFPYEYSHETPFPILEGENSTLVDSCFNNVFANSVRFLL